MKRERSKRIFTNKTVRYSMDGCYTDKESELRYLQKCKVCSYCGKRRDCTAYEMNNWAKKDISRQKIKQELLKKGEKIF